MLEKSLLNTQSARTIASKAIATIYLAFCLVISLNGQDKHSQQNYQAGIPYSISDIEDINLTNGNLMFNFGFGTVKGRGTAATGMSLKYNSKRYESHVMTTLDVSGNNAAQRFLREDFRSGWQYDSNYELRVISRNDELDQPIQVQAGLCTQPTHDATYLWKVIMYFPDGSQHEFRPTGYSDQAYNAGGTPIYDGNGYFNVNPSGQIRTMVWSSVPSESCGGGNSYAATVYTSQHVGPKMTYYSTDGTFIRLEIPVGQEGRDTTQWTLYMPDGSRVTNGEVDAQNNPLPQRIYDKNGNFVSGALDQLGRYISRVAVSPMEDHIQRPGVNGEPIIWKIRWKYITVIRRYRTSGTQEQQQCCYSYQVLFTQLKVVDEIELPSQMGGQKYIFEYDGHEGQVEWNGSTENPNSSPGWGDLKSITLPAGAKAEYDYAFLIDIRTNNLLPKLGMVKEKRLKYEVVYDGSASQITDTWQYLIDQPRGTTTVTSPDGGVTTQNFFRTDMDTDLSGRVNRETSPNGTIVERTWASNKVGGCPSYGCGSMRRLNTYVKTEFTTIPDASGNPSLTVIKDFDYDKNGNVTKVTEYDWIPYTSMPGSSTGHITGIPSGAVPVRTTENSYYNQTDDASNSTANNGNSYWNTTAPNVRVALSSTTVKNGAGTSVSRSEFNYFDVNTTANLIETKMWDSTKGAITYPLSLANSVITTAQYDPYGNVILTTDAKGVETAITYGSVGGYTGLYPTQGETASNYSTLKRTSAAVYDFHTGLATTATDVDNNVSVVTEYDALGRPTKVRSAANTLLESWTRTEYNDVARRVIVRSDLETIGDGKKVAVQHYDQLGRVRLSRSIENIASEDPYNEHHGIKVQTRYQTGNPNSYQITSNPFRAATATAATNEQSMGWTRSMSVNTGRHAETESFSGASLPAPWGTNTTSTGKVQTDIDSNATTVTDQALKQRRSITNGLGQLIRVDEPDGSSATGSLGAISSPNQPTNYSYDTLNNLTTVSQIGTSTQQCGGTLTTCSQTRTFVYDSLSRLKQANNPESGIINYLYDNNSNLTSKTDARLVVTNYVYDALNRVTQRNYNAPSGLANYQATPNVTYTYDNLPNAKGKLTKVTNGTGANTSTTEYVTFDILGRVTRSKQTTDGVVYGTDAAPMTYTYNLSGALIEQKYPSGRVVKNVLDAEGDLAQVQSQKNATDIFRNYANSFVYTAAGAVSSMRLGNGKFENTVFNSRLQPIQIGLGASANAQNLLKLNYDYGLTDNNGNVKSQTITVPTVGSNAGFTANQTYTYDSLNRINDAKEMIGTTQTWKQTFLYDRYGNRNFDTTLNRTTTIPSGCSTAVCNPGVNVSDNRLKTSDGYVFDNAGNTTKDAQLRKFTYDAENKQVKVETVNSGGTVTGTNGEYWYDGDGKRIKKKGYTNNVLTEETIFVYNAAGKLVAEYSTNVAPASTAQVAYLTNDHLGSPRINTDANGAVISRHDYLPFGEEVFTTQRTSGLGYAADTVRKKFTGYERDNESNLDFAQARYYASGFGRFSTVDPIFESMNTSMPQSMNRYTYVLNNPLFYVDPDGELWVKNEKPEYGRTQEYIWVDQCGKGQTCYTALAVSGKYQVTVYGSNDYKDITNYQANKDGVIDVRDLSMHHDASFEVANGQAVPEEFLSTNAASTLFNVAEAYSQDFPGEDKLVFTAGSAKNGKPGICNGAPCHGGHKGDDIDLRYMGVDGKAQQGKDSWGRGAINRTNYLIQKFAEAGFNHAFTGNDSAFGQPDPSPKYIDNLEKVHHHHLHVGKTAPKQKRK